MLLINDCFLFGFLILILGCIVAAIFKVKPFRIFFWSLVYVYILIVLGITLFPIPYQDVGNFTSVPHNFIPFKSISATLQMGLTFTAVIQIGGNILISAPYGVMLDLLITKKKKGLFLLLAFLFPLLIELLQLFVGLIIGLTYRSFDIDDFILNLIGVYLGSIFSNIFFKKYRHGIHQKLFTKAIRN